MNRLIPCVLVAASLLGCEQKSEAPAAATPPAQPAAAAPAAPTAPPAAAPAATAPAAVADMPTAVDFEQAAQDDINPQNMEAELDRLEKEIAN